MAVNHDVPTNHGVSPLNKINKFYCKYLPTDKETFDIRYSLSSLIVSLFALQLFFFFIWFADGQVFLHAFYVLLGSVHYGLYHGLKTGKLRLVTPWLSWKIIEIVYTIAVIIKGTICHHHYSTFCIILAFILVVINIIMMFCLYKSQVESSEVRNFHIDSESKKTTPEV